MLFVVEEEGGGEEEVHGACVVCCVCGRPSWRERNMQTDPLSKMAQFWGGHPVGMVCVYVQVQDVGDCRPAVQLQTRSA